MAVTRAYLTARGSSAATCSGSRAGASTVHSEMFPPLRPDAGNRLELFRIGLNLPTGSKFAAPYFTMCWNSEVSRMRPAGRVRIAVVAGALDGADPLAQAWRTNRWRKGH